MKYWYNMDKPWKIMLSESSQSQKITYYILDNSIYMKCSEQTYLYQQKEDWWLLKLEEGEGKWNVTANR